LEKLFIFYRFLQLLGGILWIALPQLAMGGVFIIAIRVLIDTNWLQWLVIIMLVGGVFYSLYLQINEYVQKETMKVLEKVEKQKTEIAKGTYKGGMFLKVPTLKEGIWNWTKAIFWVGLFLLALKYF
jgi:hypothetical protein|tara:strand:- start:1053 stop:1433 length:381 start_codon:yes stop_codon:yes gene_type:complete